MQATAFFFIYQARESSMVPAGFLIAQFLQKHLLSLVLMGKLGWGLFALLAWIKVKVETSLFFFLPRFSTLSIFSPKAM